MAPWQKIGKTLPILQKLIESCTCDQIRISLAAVNIASLVVLVASLSTTAAAEIGYRVTPSSDRQTISIAVSFNVTTAGVELQMPSWSPGIYSLQNPWETLRDLTGTFEDGTRASMTRTRGDTWSVSTVGHKRITVQYERSVQYARFDADQTASDEEAIHYGTPAVYLYLVGRKSDRCILELAVPSKWQIAVALPLTKSREGYATFAARNYDELLDSPVTMGSFILGRYSEFGKQHVLAFRGPAKNWVDHRKTIEIARLVTRIEGDFFGGAPYAEYVWHLWVHEASPLAGGTEHANSVEMHLATEEGDNTVQGMAHEFFHLWNGKRIRPFPLGPIDYTQLPHTGTLWWVEGITDYYSALLPYRYGAWNRDAFLARALDQIQQVRGNPARLEVSPYDSSYKMFAQDPYSYKVNYYPTGWVLGMMFDIEIRSKTDEQYSLDDVVRTLWHRYRSSRSGFSEDEIRRQLIHFGGGSMGPLYDRWVLRPGELPVEQELAKAGLTIEQSRESVHQASRIQERSDLSRLQRRVLENWLRTEKPVNFSPSFSARPAATTGNVEAAKLEGDTGRYEIANNVLFTVILDTRGLSAGLEEGDKSPLIPVFGDKYFYARRNAELTFARDEHGEVTSINWKQDRHQRSVPRIGPFLHSLHKQADPDPALTAQVSNVLQALGKGVHSNVPVTGLAPGALADYSVTGPVHGLVGIRSLDYIDSQGVGGRGLERHHGDVSRIAYYKLTTDKHSRYLMVYFTHDGLVTDFDYVED